MLVFHQQPVIQPGENTRKSQQDIYSSPLLYLNNYKSTASVSG